MFTGVWNMAEFELQQFKSVYIHSLIVDKQITVLETWEFCNKSSLFCGVWVQHSKACVVQLVSGVH